MNTELKSKKPHMMGLAIVTYSLVIGVTLLSVAAYYFYRSQISPTDQPDADPTKRMLVGAVWVPIFEKATYVEPSKVEEKEIATGMVRFHTKVPAGEVLGFYKDKLEHTGYLVKPSPDAGGMLQGVANAGKISVQVTVTSGSGPKGGENTAGEIRTLRHIDPKDAKRTSPAY
jgi:hypothetical protein